MLHCVFIQMRKTENKRQKRDLSSGCSCVCVCVILVCLVCVECICITTIPNNLAQMLSVCACVSVRVSESVHVYSYKLTFSFLQHYGWLIHTIVKKNKILNLSFVWLCTCVSVYVCLTVCFTWFNKSPWVSALLSPWQQWIIFSVAYRNSHTHTPDHNPCVNNCAIIQCTVRGWATK